MARPSKLTKETATKVINAIHQCCFVETAAAVAGVARSTLHEWLRRGEIDLKAGKRTIAAQLKKDFDAASATAELNLLTIVDKAAPNDWKAAAFKLERRWPDRWARRQVLSVTRDDGIMTSTMLDLQNLNDTDLRTLRELIKKGAKHRSKDDKKQKGKDLH